MSVERPIPDEWVRAAARALNLEAGRQRGLAFEDDWDTLTEQERGGWRLCARAALAAVREDIERAERERIAELIRPMLATGWPDEILAAIREGGQHGE